MRSNYDLVVAAGANVVIVLGHVPYGSFRTLAAQVADLNIPLFLSGHDHLADRIRVVENSYVIDSGSKLMQFAKIELRVNTTTNTTELISAKHVNNPDDGRTPNSNLEVIVSEWKNRIPSIDEIITYSSIEIVGDPRRGKLISDSFLHCYRSQYGIEYNFGAVSSGFRNDYPEGNITISNIVAVTPFPDTMLNITLTGQQVIDYILGPNNPTGFVSGIDQPAGTADESAKILVGNEYILINKTETYTGIISTFIYEQFFQVLFNATDSDIHYYEPVICYFDTIDDLTDFDNEKYIPSDHVTDGCVGYHIVPRPATVKDLRGDVSSSSQTDLSWTANTETYLQSYNIYRDGTIIGSTTTTSFIDSELLPSTEYSYQVTGIGEDGQEGDKSNEFNVTTQVDTVYVTPVYDCLLRLSFTCPPTDITTADQPLSPSEEGESSWFLTPMPLIALVGIVRKMQIKQRRANKLHR